MLLYRTEVHQKHMLLAILWGLVSITLISLLSLSGIAFIPLVRSEWRNRWMQMFIALAISTLSSDALLHIIPQVSLRSILVQLRLKEVMAVKERKKDDLKI